MLNFCSQTSVIVIFIKKYRGLFSPCSRKKQSELYQFMILIWQPLLCDLKQSFDELLPWKFEYYLLDNVDKDVVTALYI